MMAARITLAISSHQVTFCFSIERYVFRCEFIVDAQDGCCKREELGNGKHSISRNVVCWANQERSKSQSHGSDEAADGDGLFYDSAILHDLTLIFILGLFLRRGFLILWFILGNRRDNRTVWIFIPYRSYTTAEVFCNSV